MERIQVVRLLWCFYRTSIHERCFLSFSLSCEFWQRVAFADPPRPSNGSWQLPPSVNKVHPSNKMLILERKNPPAPLPPPFSSTSLKGNAISCLWKGKSPLKKACERRVGPMQALVFLFIRGCFYSAGFDRASSPFPPNWADWGHFLNGLLFTLQS